MFLKQSTIHNSSYQPLFLLVGLALALSVTSCRCKNMEKPGKAYGGLTLEVTPTSLVGEAKTIEATFTADSQKSANLTKYQVRITLIETGGTGSTLSYTDGTKATKVITNMLQESVGHFFSSTVLKPNESPLKVPFTLVSGTGVSSVAIQFELLDKKDQPLQAATVNWTKAPAQLRIAKLAYGPLRSMVTYNLQNSGQEVADKVQLRYTNVSEDAAGKTVLLNDKETNVLSLGDIAVGSSTGDKSLVLDFKAATQATFKFEILYQGTVVATQEEKFSIKVPRLKITPVGATFLVGNDRIISFKVESEDVAEEIELDKLSVQISHYIIGDIDVANQPTTLYKNSVVTEKIKDVDIGLNQNTFLTIQPGGVSKTAFNIQLYYDGVRLNAEQAFVWKSDTTAKPTLCDAAEMDNIELLKQLLAKGDVQVNATNENGDSALNIYARKNNPEAIKLLIDKGADVNLRRTSPSDATYYSAPLNLAARYGNQAVINQFLQAPGINVNFKNSAGNTPLHSLVGASWNQATAESIRQLIQKGADVNAIDNYGDTPLHHAALQSHRPALLEELLKVPGIAINIKDHEGNTPLHIAVQAESIAIIKLLLDQGARQDIVNNEGKTVRDLAAASINGDLKQLFGI